MKINAKRIISKAKCHATEFSLMYKSLTNVKRQQAPREVYLRPSMLPTCSIKLLDAMIAYSNDTHSDWGFGADYFTSVGTTVHEFIERWCSESHSKIWGHWKCLNPDCQHEHQFTHENTCSKCGSKMGYHEIEIEYLGFKGHIDCIILTKKGVQICDYKTTTKDKAKKLNYKTHNMGYPLQINAYAYMLDKVWGHHFKEKYGLGMAGASLLFISRDNPFQTQEFHWTYADGRDIGRKILYRSLLQFRAALKDFNNLELRRTLKFKACPNRQAYEDNEKTFHTYEDCPYLGMCFNKEKITRYFTERFSTLDPISVRQE